MSTQNSNGTLRPKIKNTVPKGDGDIKPFEDEITPFEDDAVTPFEEEPIIIDDEMPKNGGNVENEVKGKKNKKGKQVGSQDMQAYQDLGKARDTKDDTQSDAAQIKVLKRDKQDTSNTITLGGVTYNIDTAISNSTGEAEIYKVSKGGKEYALKLYYSGISVDLEVSAILKRIAGSGFLVDLIDYGTWTSPQGEIRSYELMPYYSGGDLKAGMFAGKPDQLKAAITAMMLAIKTAHDHNILHFDIKPCNFFYVDESHTQIILADFGVASAFQRDKKGNMIPLKLNDQNRTKIYAAPETYRVVKNYYTQQDEIVYNDDKSDYFSLGMTVLTLWSGEKALESYDEHKLLSLKNKGAIPYPEDMPEVLLRLVKGLTLADSDKRWGFEEFERWVKGEIVPIEGENVQTEQVAGALNIIWSGSKNQVANTLEELAALMANDKKLAAQYLYSGKIAEWLGKANYPELQIQIDEYLKLYPKDSDAGIMATAYLLDSELPFYAPTGKKLHTQEEIATDMSGNAPTYIKELTDKNSSLYVYFRSAGIEYANRYLQLATKQPIIALWRLIFELDPSQGFPLIDPESNTYTRYYTVNELIEGISNLPEDVYVDADQYPNGYPQLLLDEAFISWLAFRDPALAGKIKGKLKEESNSKNQLYYYVFYLLDVERGFFLNDKSEGCFTIAEVAQFLNQDYINVAVLSRDENGKYSGEYSNSYGRYTQLSDINDTRLYYYLKSKELYQDKYDYIIDCFDLTSKDHTRQAGPYNVDIAYFKAFKALNGEAFYYFKKCDKIVWTLDDLKKVPKAEVREEIEHGDLSAWLAVQYQEDPWADYSEQYTYETLLGEYTETLGKYMPNLAECQNYHQAQGLITKRARKIKGMKRQVWIMRGFWFVLAILPLLAITWLYLKYGIKEDSLSSFIPHIRFKFGAIAGLCLLITPPALILMFLRFLFDAIDDFVYDHFTFGIDPLEDFFIDRPFWSSFVTIIFIVAIFGGLAWVGSLFGGRMMAAACAALIIWRWWRVVFDLRLYSRINNDLTHPDTEALIVEPLFYAWDDNVQTFNSETYERQEKYYNGVRAARNMTFWRTLRSILLALVMLGVWTTTVPAQVEDNITERYPNLKIKLENLFSKKDKENDDDRETTSNTVEIYKVVNVNNSVNVRKEANANSKSLGTIKKDAEVEVIETDIKGFAKVKYDGSFGYINQKYLEKVERQEPVENKSEKKSKEKSSKTTADEKPAKSSASPESGKIYTAKYNYRNIDLYEGLDGNEVWTTISSGDEIEYLEKVNSTMVKVRYQGHECYANSVMIESMDDLLKVKKTDETGKTYKVKTSLSAIRAYSFPSSYSKEVETINKGEEFTFVGEAQHDFVKINHNGKESFVNSSDIIPSVTIIQVKENANTGKTFKIKSYYNTVDIFPDATGESESIGHISSGEVFTYLGKTANSYVKIRYKGQDVYIFESSISPSENQ